MAQRQRSFEIALKKGEIGEQIITEYLEARGWIVYRPFTKDKAHYFDMLLTKNKEQVLAIDVKTKGRLNKWRAQGINVKSYNQYKELLEKIKVPFYLIFIDDKNGDVHCANLSKLDDGFNPNPYIIAWPIQKMQFMFNIGEEKITALSELDQRNYEYKPK